MPANEIAPEALNSADVPVRSVRMGERNGTAEWRADGTILLRSSLPPLTDFGTWNDRLAHWGKAESDRAFLTEAADGGDRRTLTFGQALEGARKVARALLAHGLNAELPLAVLGENTIEVALMTLGAHLAGVPVSPISPSYALLATDFAKLQGTIDALGAGMVFVQDGERYGAAVQATIRPDIPIVSAGRMIKDRATQSFEDFIASPHAADIDLDSVKIAGDTVAKIMFTSGSSGAPKPVMLPHRMLADNRAQLMQVYEFLQDEPPVLVDWLPWHHTFGGINNFGFALWCGGTLHIDAGRPNPNGVLKTIELIKRYSPTLFFNSPSGFEAMIPHLRDDAVFRAAFFSKLKLLQYGGAMLPVHLWEALDDLAVAETGTRILMVSGIGSTECGPTPVQSSWEQHRKPEAGLPVPGVVAKLVPFEDTFELRLKGDCITPGYWRRPDLTEQAFDDEGFFLLGDAVKPVDPNDFARGLLFDGRISDSFKLSTGTWVAAMAIRQKLLEGLAPLLTDAVVTGHNRNEIGAIGFADMDTARRLAQIDSSRAEDIFGSVVLRQWIHDRLSAMAASAGGSSQRIMRFALSDELPSLDNGELTDKGTASARAVLQRRQPLVEALHAPEPSPEIIVV